VTSHLPSVVIERCRLLLGHIATLDKQISTLGRRLCARDNDTTKRLMSIPASVRSMQLRWRRWRQHLRPLLRGTTSRPGSASPRQSPSGSKARLGRMSRMGQRDLRRLLIIGAMSVVRWGAPARRAGGFLAWPYVGAEASNDCRDRACEQVRPDRLGSDVERRG